MKLHRSGIKYTTSSSSVPRPLSVSSLPSSSELLPERILEEQFDLIDGFESGWVEARTSSDHLGSLVLFPPIQEVLLKFTEKAVRFYGKSNRVEVIELKSIMEAMEGSTDYVHKRGIKLAPARLPAFHTCVGANGERLTPKWYKEHGARVLKLVS
ncbi:hypothetical protein K1719_016375 [Acacia pycnantha]|nr:hypothetical protein K1719_016375 [Acacia pycnantha]